MASFQSRKQARIAGNVSSRDLSLRTHPLVLGTVLFLVSDLMIFCGLIAAYFNLRGIATAWPPPDVTLDRGAAAFGTVMLAVSSGSMLFCTHFLARNAFALARFWLGITIVLGAAFVLETYHGWLTTSFRLGSHAYGSIYYLMTGFHTFHVLIGTLLLTVLFFNMEKAAFERDARAGVEAIGFFWHFVFLIWIFVGGTIFVIR